MTPASKPYRREDHWGSRINVEGGLVDVLLLAGDMLLSALSDNPEDLAVKPCGPAIREHLQTSKMSPNNLQRMQASEIEALVYRNPSHCVYTIGPRTSRLLKFVFVAAIVNFVWIECVHLLVNNGLLPVKIYGFSSTFGVIAVFSAYVYNVWVNNQVRLTITSSGIEYRAVGYTIFTPWNNIEHLGLEQTLGGEREALILREPIVPQVKWWKIIAKPNMVSAIPLAEFGHWRYKPLGQDLRHYAPHLFT